MAKSAVSSLFDLYNSITASYFGGTDRPPLFLGEAAQTKSDASQQRLPFVVLFDEGFRPEFNSSAGGIERGEIRLEIYQTTLGAASGVTVDSIALAIKYGGSAPSAKAGFDWGTLAFASESYLYKVHLRRTMEKRSYAGFLDKDLARVYKCELRYEVIDGISLT